MALVFAALFTLFMAALPWAIGFAGQFFGSYLGISSASPRCTCNCQSEGGARVLALLGDQLQRCGPENLKLTQVPRSCPEYPWHYFIFVWLFTLGAAAWLGFVSGQQWERVRVTVRCAPNVTALPSKGQTARLLR